MPPQFDFYVRRNSTLHRLDPRLKFLFVVETTLLLFLWPSAWTSAVMIAFTTGLLRVGQVPWRRIAQIWRTMAPLLALVFVLTAFFTQAAPATVLLRLGPVAVTQGALSLGLMIALRLLALALIISLWLFTTDQATMVRGFVALGLPYTGGLTLALALRYVPIFAGLFTQVRQAQQARGLELDQGPFWRRLRLHRPVLVAMIILAVRQSEQLGWALEARALGAPGVRRTVYHPLRFARHDWLVLVVLAAAGVILAALRVL